jgi:hypothetical protein
LRLGHVNSPLFDSKLASRSLINILPLSFKPFEDQAIQIIKSTEFAGAAERIDWKYFEGRLVA